MVAPVISLTCLSMASEQLTTTDTSCWDEKEEEKVPGGGDR